MKTEEKLGLVSMGIPWAAFGIIALAKPGGALAKLGGGRTRLGGISITKFAPFAPSTGIVRASTDVPGIMKASTDMPVRTFTDVPLKSNFTGILTYKNNKLDPGIRVLVGFCMALDHRYLVFEYDGVEYFFGSCKAGTTPDQGESKEVSCPSRMIVDGDLVEKKLDAFAWVGIATGTIHYLTSGGRVVGMNREDLENNLKVAGSEWFDDVLTVKPEEAAAIDITGFEIEAR